MAGVLPAGAHARAGAFDTLLTDLGARPQGSALENHLQAHGLPPMPVPDRPRVTVYWTGGAGAGPAEGEPPRPVAVCVEALEPLRRTRRYPEPFTDTTTSIPVQRYVLRDTEWLTVRAGGTAPVAGLVWAPGDQRVFVVLGAGARGTRLTADLVSPALPHLPFLDLGERTAPLLDVVLDRAPWEED